MVKKAIIALLVTGGFVLVGCSQADPTPTMVPEATAIPPTATVSQVEEIVEATPEIQVIDSVEELAGTWRFHGTRFRRFFEDGTWVAGPSLIILDIRTDAGEIIGEYWFEDGLFHTTDYSCEEEEGVSEAGVYQIQRVENERIRFVEVDEPCAIRRNSERTINQKSARKLDED